MKKIFLYIISIMALVGCMNEETFIVDNPVVESYESFSAPLEISVGHSQTKAFDEYLKWSWEESDKIYGYQVAGGKSVNTLTFVEDNRFGTPEFVYSSQDAATFHFVYAGDATLDEAAEGNRGIRQDSRQSGEWSPVLVGSAVGKTISEVMNDEAEIDMEHLSAALEVRLWKEGVDKANLTDADKKNIVYAELMSDTENFLLDVVPVYNLDGTVSYANRERGQDEEDGGYIRTEYVNSPVAVFNIAPHAENYQAGALRLAIMDENGDRYVLDVPALNFVAGRRTILNVEWKTPTSAYLPDGETFKSTVDAFMTGKGITEIKFITNSATTSENALVDGSIYLVQNGQTLEIHTAAGQFMANSSCSYMFDAYEGWDNSTSQAILNSFGQIQVIDFGENFNTQNVTSMSYIFRYCRSLTSLDVSNFDTRNVTDMSFMFYDCSSLTSLDVSNFNAQNVIDMGYMFCVCRSLTSLDVSNFKTQNVTDMGRMFHGCSGLTSLDVSNFNTQNVTNMGAMFYDCSSLTSLDLSNFTFESNPDIELMFVYTGSNATNKPIPIYVSAEGKNYIETKGNRYISSNNATLTDKETFKESAYLPDGETFNSTVDAFMTGKGITEIKFITNSATTSEDALVDGSIYLLRNGQTLEIHTAAGQFMANSNCYRMFSAYEGRDYSTNQYIYNSFGQIQVIDFGENFNTQNVTYMREMFRNCSSLTSLDLSNFSTQNVTDMGRMFYNCRSLTSLDLSNFTFESNPDIQYMFSFTGSEATNQPIPIYVSAEGKDYIETKGNSYISSNYAILTDKETFKERAYLPDGGTFNSTVDAFMTGKGITEIKFITNSATTSEDALVNGRIYLLQNGQTLEIHTAASQFMANSSCSDMFAGRYYDYNLSKWVDRTLKHITTIDFGDNFNTQNVTDMYSMFNDCSSLTSLDVSNFNTQNVTDMYSMFNDCSSLTSLDLSNFNTQNVTDMSFMFDYCSSLTSLDMSSFTFDCNPNIGAMFSSTGSNAANRPIPIYVSAEGKSYIETKGNSSINSNYATLTIKAPQAE